MRTPWPQKTIDSIPRMKTHVFQSWKTVNGEKEVEEGRWRRNSRVSSVHKMSKNYSEINNIQDNVVSQLYVLYIYIFTALF